MESCLVGIDIEEGFVKFHTSNPKEQQTYQPTRTMVVLPDTKITTLTRRKVVR